MTKKLLGAALLGVLGTTMLFGQSGMRSDKNAATERNIQKMETSLWQGWKDHNAKPFEEHIANDFLNLANEPERDKASMVKEITSDNCKVSGFSLSDFAYKWLDAKSVIVTYVGTQDAVCGGAKIPAKVNASSVWVKRGNKWMAVFHQESPAM